MAASVLNSDMTGDSSSREPEWALYKEQLGIAREDQRSSSDEFDKNLMTLSSGALALSLGFIKDVVHLPQALYLRLLIISWACFAFAILTTLISYLCSGRAIQRHMHFLYRYYIDRDDAFLNKRSKWDLSVSICAAVGATAFIAGVVMTVAFTTLNVLKGQTLVNEESKDKATSKWVGATDARPANMMVRIPNSSPEETRGRNPMPMTAIPNTPKPTNGSIAQATNPTPAKEGNK